jgi:hypothetical protein
VPYYYIADMSSGTEYRARTKRAAWSACRPLADGYIYEITVQDHQKTIQRVYPETGAAYSTERVATHVLDKSAAPFWELT